MKLKGPYTLTIRGNTDTLITAGGRRTDVIGYLFERLLTGEEAAMEELSTWGIEVRIENDEFVRVPRLLDDGSEG